MSGPPGAPLRVLFLCTGNSARSILAESVLRARGAGRFESFSAGSFPKGAVHPLALRLLAEQGLPADGLRSKSWDEFAAPGFAPMDAIITVCDAAAGETCPIWPGQPVTAHWGIPDPAAVTQSEAAAMQAFRAALAAMERRIGLLLALPAARLDRAALAAIGRTADEGVRA